MLGFRDRPLPTVQVPAAYKENSVRAWVAEHYGPGSDSGSSAGSTGSPSICDSIAAGNLYQNCAELRHEQQQQQHSQTLNLARISTTSVTSAASGTSIDSSRTLPAASSSKRLPPPPPKRSDTTHLSTTARIH